MVQRISLFLTFLLLTMVSACATLPPAPPALDLSLDLSLTQLSKQNRFLVTLVPPEGVVGIQQIQSWQIKLATPAGVPIPKALVYLNGGMPEHGHGLPTHPVVTKEIVPGTYLLEGLKFSMPGWWELIVAVQVNGMEDMTYFNKIIPVSGTGK